MLLFHGSPEANLERLEPKIGKKPQHLSIKPRIFASPDLKTALVHSRDWTSEDLEFGTINLLSKTKQTKHVIREARPGAFEVLKGCGHIYGILNPKPFRPVIKEGGEPSHREFVAETAVPIVHLIEVPNVLHACYFFRMCMYPYGEKEGGKQYVRIFVTYNGVKGIMLHHYLNKKKWGPPAGRVEEGENLFVAAARELKERTGFTGNPMNFRLLGSYLKGGNTWHLFQVGFDDVQQVGKPQTEIRWSDRSKVKTSMETMKSKLLGVEDEPALPIQQFLVGDKL